MPRHNPDRNRAILTDIRDREQYTERLTAMANIPVKAHRDIASQQLLEILQYAANGQPLDAAIAYDHFTLALGHIAAARGERAHWFWTDEPSPALVTDDEHVPTSLELLNAARDAGETIGHQFQHEEKPGDDGTTFVLP